VLKRFMFASLAFVGLIVPGAFALALLAAPAARPEPLQQAGCARSLVDAAAGIAAMQRRASKVSPPRVSRKSATPRGSIF
jgi:hypothetical protein